MALFNYKELEDIQLSKNESYRYLKNNNILGNAKDISLDNIRYEYFDIFLSHSYNDKKIIPALKKELEKMGYTVYVDWITDKLLSRNDVNKKTAEVLQIRMKQSKCLIYATSKNSQKSRWMPWELGYFDGIKDKMVGILPIKKKNNNFKEDFKGEEYLGLYFYIDKEIERSSTEILRVNEDAKSYVKFDEWLNGKKPYRR